MIVSIACVLFAIGSTSLAEQDVRASALFTVTDDTGNLVSNAAVDGCFLDLSQSGGRDRFSGPILSNGTFAAAGRTSLGLYARFFGNGFYPTTVKLPIECDRSQQRQARKNTDRWNVQTPVRLKRILNPIPMYRQSVEMAGLMRRTDAKYTSIVTNSTFGYDLLEGSAVAPYGHGRTADVEVGWQLMVLAADESGMPVDSDSLFEVRLTNVLDGIQRGVPDGSEDGQIGSAYLSQYEAPQDGYVQTVSFFRNVRGRKAESNDDGHYLYYFRIRTQTNELGQVTNALYGKIYGRLNGNFTYYLNPTPNDRNVEFDPTRNLFENLRPSEAVRVP